MEQRRLNFTTATAAAAKEECLIHRRQGPHDYCTYYALAMLKNLDPKVVVETAKDVLHTTRLGKLYRKVGGSHILIRATFDRLGYVFPSNKFMSRSIRIKTLNDGVFDGSGLARLKCTKGSHTGHLIAFKNGVIYDSREIKAYRVTVWLKKIVKKRRYCWINLVTEEDIEQKST